MLILPFAYVVIWLGGFVGDLMVAMNSHYIKIHLKYPMAIQMLGLFSDVPMGLIIL